MPTRRGGAADFLLSTMRARDGTLLRRFRDGDAAIPGMLDDYAFFAQGLLDLYEATFEFRYLDAAIAITEKQRELFEDEAGGFFASAHEDASRLMRIKDDYDGAEPSGNSVALMNLLRLHRITGRADFESSARKLIAAFRRSSAARPYWHAADAGGLRIRSRAAAGNRGGGRSVERNDAASLEEFRSQPHSAPCRSEELRRCQPAIAAMNRRSDETTVYVCENFTCQAPVTDEEDLADC